MSYEFQENHEIFFSSGINGDSFKVGLDSKVRTWDKRNTSMDRQDVIFASPLYPNVYSEVLDAIVQRRQINYRYNSTINPLWSSVVFAIDRSRGYGGNPIVYIMRNGELAVDSSTSVRWSDGGCIHIEPPFVRLDEVLRVSSFEGDHQRPTSATFEKVTGLYLL
jgi:hypothetical protein